MRIHDISFAGVTLHPYSLRIDIDFDPPYIAIPFPHPYFDKIYNWIRLNFKYSLVAREKSKLGKWHLQCFCLHNRSYENKELLKMRHYIKAHLATQSTKQPVSLKKSFSPVGLFKYCQKDGDIKLMMPDELFKYLEHLAQAGLRRPREQVLHSVAQKACSLKGLVELLVEQVALGALQCVPRKAELWKLALHYHLVTFDTFYEEFYAPRIT